MDKCIDKFLSNYKPGNVEKHSDSSDFDETQTIPFICPKRGKHSLLVKAPEIQTKPKKENNVMSCKSPAINEEQTHMPVLEDSMIPVRDSNPNRTNKKNRKRDDINLNNKGDKLNSQSVNSKETPQKPAQCFSNIFRRYNNNAKQNLSIKEIPENHLNSGKTFCADCERRRIKKLNRRRRSYVVQPVYVDNVQGGPVSFGHANDRAPLTQHNHKVMRKQDSNTSYELTSSDSEIGKADQRKHLSRRRYFIDKLQKELRKEYLKYEKELSKNHAQQYPSKRDYNVPNSVFSTPHCQVMNAESLQNTGPSTIIPTTSSGFWEYIYDRVCGKNTPEKDNRPCYCRQQPVSSQVPENSESCPPYQTFQQEEMAYNELNTNLPECKSCLQQTEDTMPDKIAKVSPVANKKTSDQNVKCNCDINKKRKKQNESSKNPQMSLTQGNDVTRPCQEPHDDITRTVEEKYNGEILCIHNPPCILINGCLNLPNLNKTPPTQGNFWPVTQDKKTSFYHMCRKITRPKIKRCEQACQYHPPSIDVQTLQVKSEKIVQSICNHNPPCEVVYGCYKPKYDPKLENSCIHVPMCQRLPECRIKEKSETESSKECEHRPKCTDVPLCSRKFVVLTARGTVGTQVRPKSKLVCRHEPPCIMIPKCLARIISDGYIQYDAIPDCVHQPCCEMIPACCRKAAKEMVSASSQYPNACRIV